MIAARAFVVMLAVVLLGGCRATTPPSEPAGTPDVFALAPAAVRDRAPLPACGTEGASVNTEARQCFWNAYTTGQVAEFITTRPTDAGDGFTTIYRSLGGGRAQLFHDALARLGQGWLEVDCPGLTLTRDGAFFPDFIPGLPGRDCAETRLGAGS